MVDAGGAADGECIDASSGRTLIRLVIATSESSFRNSRVRFSALLLPKLGRGVAIQQHRLAAAGGIQHLRTNQGEMVAVQEVGQARALVRVGRRGSAHGPRGARPLPTPTRPPGNFSRSPSHSRL